MGQFQDVQTFVREANRITEIADLQPLLEDALKELGFQHYALVHHTPGWDLPEGVIRLNNYPENWLDIFVSRGYFSDNPVHCASQRSLTGFMWSQLPTLIDLTSRHRQLLNEWQNQGFGEGFTVPVNIIGEATGSCSMSVRSGDIFPTRSLPAAQYIACFAFEAARRVSKSKIVLRLQSNSNSRKALTPRQMDCLILVAQGKSDWDISRILGISAQTVHQHIETAKKKYNVSSRTQLVVRALFDNQLIYSDIIN
jgi:LuxR family quorum-sensing system transcriptional regulator CciR